MAEAGRQGRANEVAAQRRRRGDETLSASKRLPIPEATQKWAKENGLSLRWANDERNRIYALTERDDYDKVEGVAPVPVGTTEQGEPIMAHLLAKRTDFIQEDRAKAESLRAATEKRLVEAPSEENQSSRRADYVDKASSIGRGNQVLE